MSCCWKKKQKKKQRKARFKVLQNQSNLHQRFGKSFSLRTTCDRVPHNLVSCLVVEVNAEVILVNSTINCGCDFVQESNSFDEVPNVMLPLVNFFRTTPIQTAVHFLVNVLLLVHVVVFVLLKKENQDDVNAHRKCTKQQLQHNHESFLVEQTLGVCQHDHMRTPT